MQYSQDVIKKQWPRDRVVYDVDLTRSSELDFPSKVPERTRFRLVSILPYN
jgi:hypothetical protein